MTIGGMNVIDRGGKKREDGNRIVKGRKNWMKEQVGERREEEQGGNRREMITEGNGVKGNWV